jgi:hypothetical protein
MHRLITNLKEMKMEISWKNYFGLNEKIKSRGFPSYTI